MSTLERGTGRSALQIMDAPLGSIYICPHHASIHYHKHLAYDLGRYDIRFESPMYLERPESFYGIRNVSLVIDHAAWFRFTEHQRAHLEEIRHIIKYRGGTVS